MRAAKAMIRNALAARGYELRHARERPVALERPWALLCFHLPWVLTATDDLLARKGHSILWEDRELARVLWRLGYNVRGVHNLDASFVPDRPYEVALGLGDGLARLAPQLPGDCVKLLYSVYSEPAYHNAAEAARVRALNERRGAACRPRRAVRDPQAWQRALELCDAALLNGNEHTLATYPAAFRHKMRLVTTPGSYLGRSGKPVGAPVPPEREFLWFFGGGAAHKGLDLVLEVFARNPRLVLHVAGGDLQRDPAFVDAYRRELTACDNIRVYGRLEPPGREFAALVRRCCAFVAPSCAEAASAAVVTCLKAGLYPIVSRDCGVTLPPGAGTYLETCSVDEIEEAVLATHAMPAADLQEATAAAHADALRRYTPEAFTAAADAFLRAETRSAHDPPVR